MVQGEPCGQVMWGGSSQRGRMHVSINGTGCGFVQDWDRAQDAIALLPGVERRRVDIAADFYDGSRTYEQAVEAYRRGAFKRGRGMAPSMNQHLPESIIGGRTMYVGKRSSDVYIRVYEKGKKELAGLKVSKADRLLRKVMGEEHLLGSCTTNDPVYGNGGTRFTMVDWLRMEVELKSSSGPLPDDVIDNRDAYFSGCNPYFTEVFPDVEKRLLVKPRHIGCLVVERALEHVRAQYGPTLYTAMAVHEGNEHAVWVKIVGREHSKALVEAGALRAVEVAA